MSDGLKTFFHKSKVTVTLRNNIL